MRRKNNTATIKIDYFLLVLAGSCACSLIQLWALPYRRTTLISLSNRGILFLWIIGIGLFLFKRLTRPIPQKTASIIVILGFSLAAWLLSAVSRPGSLVSALLSTLGFLALPIMISYSAFFKIDPRTKLLVFLHSICASLLFIWLFHTDKAYAYDGPYGIVYLDTLTLGYYNPNQTAMYLFICLLCLVCAISFFRSKLLKAFLFADSCYIAWLLNKTESRTALLLFLVFLLLVAADNLRRLPRLWVDLAVLLPVIYLLLLPLLDLFHVNISILAADLFNGRDNIFSAYWQNLSPLTFLFGNLGRYQFANLHNSYIAIAASIGIPACVSYAVFLRNHLMLNLPQRTAPRYERNAFVAVLCTVMYTCSEAAFFVGGAHYGFLVFSLFCLFAKPFATPNQYEQPKT